MHQSPPPHLARPGGAHARSGARPLPAGAEQTAPPALDRARVRRLAVFLAVAALPALLDPDALARAGALWSLAEEPRPYLVPEHAGLLYVWSPLVALSGCVLLLAPGLVLAAALGAASDVGRWLLYGLGLDLVALSLVAGLADAALPGWWRGARFGLLAAAVAALAFLVLRARVARGASLPSPRRPLALLAPAFAVSWLLLAALAPKVHWEAFNGDGVHAFEATRLLLVQPLPFWDPASGSIGAFPGVTTMLFAYPGAWFLRLFGALEGAARVPVVLYLAGCAGGVLALAAQRRAPRAVDAWLVWLALGVYAIVMAFSASYDPYSADLALPATQDTLLVACFLGFVLAFVRGERGWLALFALLTYLSLPSGMLLMGLWLAAAWLCVRPRPWQRLVVGAAALVACVAVGVALPWALRALDLPPPGAEYEGVLARFKNLQVTDVRRLAFAAVPCGIVPALGLLAWPRLDGVARALALTAAGYFVFFYVQAFVSLHHFVPAMLLPLAAFWRSELVEGGARKPVLAAVGAGLALSLWLSLPERGAVLVHARRVGEELAVRVEGYERSAPEAFRASHVLAHLFPSGMIPEVPAERYGGSPHVWNRYARRGAAAADEASYLVQPAGAAAPAGFATVAERDGFALLVRDRARWDEQGGALLPSPPGSALYAIDRGLLFGQPPREGELRILRVGELLRRLGLRS